MGRKNDLIITNGFNVYPQVVERAINECPGVVESVVVGGSGRFERMLKVTVLEIKGRCVRLGFEVDAAVPVNRWEVWQRIRAGGGSGSVPGAPVAPSG